MVVCALRHVAALRARHQTRRCRRRPRPSPLPRASPSKCSWLMGTRQRQRSMIRILTGVKVRHAPCGAILRQITASKGSKDMYRRRLGPGSDSRRGTSRVGESVYQAPVTAGSETSDRLLCTGRAGRAGEPRQLPAVILFTAGNFSIAATHSVRLDNRRLRLCLLVSDPPTASLCTCEVGVSTWTTRVCISPTSRTSHHIPRVTVRISAPICMRQAPTRPRL